MAFIKLTLCESILSLATTVLATRVPLYVHVYDASIDLFSLVLILHNLTRSVECMIDPAQKIKYSSLQFAIHSLQFI
jgi:hypothetical protein